MEQDTSTKNSQQETLDEWPENQPGPSSNPDSAFFTNSTKQFANYVTIFETNVATLTSNRGENQELLFMFREQHEFVIEFAKHLVENLIHSELISIPDKTQLVQELRQYLTRLQMAQCRAVSHLGSLWYSLSEPTAPQFGSRAQFLIFEQQRRENVFRLEESIQEINKVMKSLTSKMKPKRCQFGAHAHQRGEQGGQLVGKSKNLHKSAHSSLAPNEEEEILPMLLPNQNYMPSSQLSLEGVEENYLPTYQHMLPPGRMQRIMLPITSRQCGHSSRSIQFAKCSKETVGASIVFGAIILCVALAGLILWLLTTHYSTNSKQKMQ